MARKLVELGVDILEAGFPIASEGDFEAVDAVSREFPWAQVAALARCCTLDVERAAQVAGTCQAAAHPHLHRHQRHSPEVQAEEDRRQQVLEEAVAAVELARRYVDDVEFSAEDGARTEPEFLEKISKAVVAAGARTVNIPDTVGYSTPDGIRRADRPHRARRWAIAPSSACTATTIWAWRWPTRSPPSQAGARQVECTINGIGERAGNCSLEEIVMILKTRADSYPYHTGIHTEHLYSASETAQLDHHLRAAAQQGHRGPQRLRARSRHPPGRLSEGEDHLRDHRPADRWACPKASWCWASTAAATRSTSAARSWAST